MICNLYNLYIPKYSKNTQEIIFFKSINFVITHRIFNIEFDSGPLKIFKIFLLREHFMGEESGSIKIGTKKVRS